MTTMTTITTTKRGPKLKKQNDAWAHVASDLSELARKWSGIRNLTVWVGPDENEPPGSYTPHNKEIQIETGQSFGENINPTDIKNFHKEKTQLLHPKATGILAHETAHALWSKDDETEFEDLNRKQQQTYALLEESRIEKQAIELNPNLKLYLRSSSLYLVNPEVTEKDIKFASRLLLLGLLRVDAGILTEDDMSACTKLIETTINPNTIATVRKLGKEFQNAPAEKFNRMKDIAREITELLHIETEDTSDPELDAELLNALQELIDIIDIEILIETGQLIQHLDKKETNKEKQEKRQEQETHKDIAEKLFNSFYSGNTTHSKLVNRRKPTQEEKVSAHKIKQAFEKARYRDRIVTVVRSTTPPGRMRVGQAMQKKAGASGRTEPWRKKQHQHVEDESLTLGIMGDISGSMHKTMKTMASATWIFSEATHKTGGNMAAVNYGNAVIPTLKPGQHLREVNEYSAADGSEDFDQAFQALDGSLNLLYGSGKRILVVCSDGNYRFDQLNATEKWLRACKNRGVAVVWLGLSQGRAKGLCAKTGTKYVPVGEDATAAINEIAQACTQALTQASRTG